MTQKATKVVIITERVIMKGVTDIIDEAGARGYTVLSAGGKGSRNVRSSGGPSVSETFTNVQIEAIAAHRDMAEQIADKVAEKYFSNYSGIAYLEEVEVLRPQKFERT